MATLKQSRTLWHAIEQNIGEMFQKRFKHADDWGNYGVSVPELERLMLEEAVPHEDREIFNRLGEKYFNKVGSITVTIHKLSYSLEFAEMYLPHKILGGYGSSSVQIKNSQVMAVHNARAEAHNNVVKERNEFVKKVKEVYDAAPSVNAALKVWEPLRDLLPPHAIEIINKKVEKNTAKKVAAEIDVTSLSVDLLKAKMTK